jgi:hypothetical protein
MAIARRFSRGIARWAIFPSPLVGEGGSIAQSAIETGEGSVSADRDPSSGADFVHATFSHKGRREELTSACLL